MLGSVKLEITLYWMAVFKHFVMLSAETQALRKGNLGASLFSAILLSPESKVKNEKVAWLSKARWADDTPVSDC